MADEDFLGTEAGDPSCRHLCNAVESCSEKGLRVALIGPDTAATGSVLRGRGIQGDDRTVLLVGGAMLG